MTSGIATNRNKILSQLYIGHWITSPSLANKLGYNFIIFEQANKGQVNPNYPILVHKTKKANFFTDATRDILEKKS